KRWPLILQNHHCPSLKANCSSFRSTSILIRQQRRLYSEGPISNSHVYLCALPMKMNGSSQPTITPPSEEIFAASTSQLPAFTVKVQGAKRRISSDPRLSKGQHTPGGLLIMEK